MTYVAVKSCHVSLFFFLLLAPVISVSFFFFHLFSYMPLFMSCAPIFGPPLLFESHLALLFSVVSGEDRKRLSLRLLHGFYMCCTLHSLKERLSHPFFFLIRFPHPYFYPLMATADISSHVDALTSLTSPLLFSSRSEIKKR